ncbi:unnamed protein product, partial [Choristocarpus tenellus]
MESRSDVDKLSDVQHLVKGYQEEIDSLTKRCRSSDSAFFSLYKSLYEAPDPAAALERAITERPRAVASEMEVEKLQAELSEYEREFSQLKNQAANASVQEAQEREVQLEQRWKCWVGVGGLELGSVKSISSVCSKVAQNMRLERESQELRRRVQRLEAGAHAPTGGDGEEGRQFTGGLGMQGLSHAEAVDAELGELSRLNSQLRGELASREAGWRVEREGLEGRIRMAEESSKASSTSLGLLKEELKVRPTVEEARSLRRQVRMLQQLEFNAGDEVELDGGDGAEALLTAEEPHGGADPEDTARHAERTMEQVIRSRVRRLEADLTSARRLAAESHLEAEKLRNSVSSSVALAAERQTVIERLEDDLATASKIL